MKNNSHFHAAKANKNDEFYTKLEDIENELAHYTDFFKDKVVYCNCDLTTLISGSISMTTFSLSV